jgi:hypothetical protein
MQHGPAASSVSNPKAPRRSAGGYLLERNGSQSCCVGLRSRWPCRPFGAKSIAGVISPGFCATDHTLSHQRFPALLLISLFSYASVLLSSKSPLVYHAEV